MVTKSHITGALICCILCSVTLFVFSHRFVNVEVTPKWLGLVLCVGIAGVAWSLLNSKIDTALYNCRLMMATSLPANKETMIEFKSTGKSSIMKKICLLMFVAIGATSVTFSNNENRKEPKRDPIPGKITMTTSGGSRAVEFLLNRGDQHSVVEGTATIDWGDDSEIETVKFAEDGLKLSYEYSDTIAYTITITSTDLTSFFKSGKRPVTSLDVSNAPGLISLALGGYTEVDASQKKVKMYGVPHQFTEFAVALNALFRTLHNYQLTSGVESTFPEPLVGYRKIVEVGGNPGAKNCDPRIANDNGWGIKVDWQ